MTADTSLLHVFQKQLALTDDQLHAVHAALMMESLPLLLAFEQIGVADEGQILRLLADHLGLPLLEREDYPEKPVLLEGVSMPFLRKHAVLPIQMESGRVTVVVNDPLNLPLINTLGSYFVDMEMQLCLGRREEILNSLDRLYEAAAREAEALTRADNGSLIGPEGFEDDLEHLKGLAQEAPIIRLVNVTISRALDSRASDIHFEPFERSFKIRYRLDGVLYDLDQHPKSYAGGHHQPPQADGQPQYC